MTYKERYGAWSGNPRGRAPDFTRCCEEVTTYNNGWPSYYQCNRKCGYGPDKAYCKQHDPDAVKARQAALTAKYNEKNNQERYKWHGRSFFKVLEKIANGHNDPRTLARETIDEFMKGMK
jgi:hypothetical protein